MKQMQKAQEINTALGELPTARILALDAKENGAEYHYSTPYSIVEVRENNGRKSYINPNKDYALVQHKEAFRPIVDALVTSGVKDFEFLTYSTPKKAELQLYVNGDIADSEGVRIGIQCLNSLDGHSVLKYGVEMDRFNRTIELVGYRQVCSNGMKIKVPLDKAEFVGWEVRDKLKNLLSETARLRHTSGVFAKIELVKYTVEAISLLRKPVEAMIHYAKAFKIEHAEVLKKLIKRHVGKRWASKVQEVYETEKTCSADLWGLYNAITFVASHDDDLSETGRERLLEKSANMLLAEIAS